jgi:hypothetical protein
MSALVSRKVGHASPTITLDTYAHSFALAMPTAPPRHRPLPEARLLSAILLLAVGSRENV